MTLAGGLLGALSIPIVTDLAFYGAYVAAWGLIFGLLNAAALGLLEMRSS